MCPLYPLHIALLYLCLALPLLLALVEGAETLAGWKLDFSHTEIGVGNETEKLRELTYKQFDVICTDCEQKSSSKYKLFLHNEDPNIASISYGDYDQVISWDYIRLLFLNIDVRTLKVSWSWT